MMKSNIFRYSFCKSMLCRSRKKRLSYNYGQSEKITDTISLMRSNIYTLGLCVIVSSTIFVQLSVKIGSHKSKIMTQSSGYKYSIAP